MALMNIAGMAGMVGIAYFCVLAKEITVEICHDNRLSFCLYYNAYPSHTTAISHP